MVVGADFVDWSRVIASTKLTSLQIIDHNLNRLSNLTVAAPKNDEVLSNSLSPLRLTSLPHLFASPLCLTSTPCLHAPPPHLASAPHLRMPPPRTAPMCRLRAPPPRLASARCLRTSASAPHLSAPPSHPVAPPSRHGPARHLFASPPLQSLYARASVLSFVPAAERCNTLVPPAEMAGSGGRTTFLPTNI